jgi:hypothetical protein
VDALKTIRDGKALAAIDMRSIATDALAKVKE